MCYGWIDSLVKRIDNETYVRKFTPRINTKNWSLINKKKVQVLLAQNRMKVAGLEKISPEILYGIKNNELTSETPKNDRQIPEFITDYINTNKVVKSNFYDLSAGRKSKFVAWICDAQKNETREKRLKAMTEMLISGKFDLLK